MALKTQSIDPLAAEQLLSKLPAGLRLNRRSIKNYSDLIRNGRWQPTHQGVVIDKLGRLISGGELLAAIGESQSTVEVKVTRDADPDTLNKYGRGRPRNSKDVLRAVCRVNTVEAPVLNAVILYVKGENSSNPLNVEAAHAIFHEAVDEVTAVKGTLASGPYWSNAAKAAVVLALVGHGYKEKVRQFLAELFDRSEASRRVLAYRRRMGEDYHKLSGRERFESALSVVAAYCGIEDSDKPESVRLHLLARAGIELQTVEAVT